MGQCLGIVAEMLVAAGIHLFCVEPEAATEPQQFFEQCFGVCALAGFGEGVDKPERAR